MNEKAGDSFQFWIFTILVVGLNALGFLWIASSISRMSAPLDAFEEAQASARTSATTPKDSASWNVNAVSGLKVPGVSATNLCDPAKSHRADETHVIGVEVNDESRAYVVEAFYAPDVDSPEDLAVHIVNDTLGDTAITVTHCDVTHSTRVLTGIGDKSNAGQDVCIGGFNKGLVLVVDDAEYPHHDTEIPLVDVPYLTTSWGDWLEQHPDTLVYTGQACET